MQRLPRAVATHVAAAAAASEVGVAGGTNTAWPREVELAMTAACQEVDDALLSAGTAAGPRRRGGRVRGRCPRRRRVPSRLPDPGGRRQVRTKHLKLKEKAPCPIGGLFWHHLVRYGTG